MVLSYEHFWLFHLRSHFRCHHALVWCSRSCLNRVAISFFVLNSFQILLVFNFLFNVLISLQQFIVFLFSDLQSSIQIALELLFQGVHFILLLLNEFGLGGDDFLMSFSHVFFSFLNFQLLANDLNLMSFGIFLLLS